MDKSSLLSDVRVVDVGSGWVGPWAGLLLADLGAEVIKVEFVTQKSMDMCRGSAAAAARKTGDAPPFYADYPDGNIGERWWNRSARFNAANFGKYGVTLDLTKTKGLLAFMRIMKVSDIFLSNMAAGINKRLGIAYEDILKVHPKIIYLSATGYGESGPYAQRVAMGNTIDAAAGHFGLRDYGDGDASAVSPTTHCDSIAASTNVFAILAALNYRRKTGKGMFIDVSMVESSISHIGEAIMDYTMNHRVQHSLGNRDASMAPQGCYRCQGGDEWVTLSISSDEEWQRLAEVMGNPGLAKDELFADTLGRLRNQDKLDQLIGDWTINKTKHEVMHLLQKVGIAAGAVLDNAEVYGDGHIKERAYLEAIDHPDTGVRSYPGRLWRLSEREMPKRRYAPLLGEHNEHVLGKIAGLTPGEILELTQEGIIGTIPI